MSRVSELPLSKLVREQVARPSPIHQIMKMAERQNIVAMGLNPDDAISFGGGFGPSLRNGVRISYGPLVTSPDKMREGVARLGRWLAL